MQKNQWLQSKRTGTTFILETFANFYAKLMDAFREEEQTQNTLYKIHNLQQSKNMLVKESNTKFCMLVGRASLTIPTTAANPVTTATIDSNKTLLINTY